MNLVRDQQAILAQTARCSGSHMKLYKRAKSSLVHVTKCVCPARYETRVTLQRATQRLEVPGAQAVLESDKPIRLAYCLHREQRKIWLQGGEALIPGWSNEPLGQRRGHKSFLRVKRTPRKFESSVPSVTKSLRWGGSEDIRSQQERRGGGSGRSNYNSLCSTTPVLHLCFLHPSYRDGSVQGDSLY